MTASTIARRPSTARISTSVVEPGCSSTRLPERTVTLSMVIDSGPTLALAASGGFPRVTRARRGSRPSSHDLGQAPEPAGGGIPWPGKPPWPGGPSEAL